MLPPIIRLSSTLHSVQTPVLPSVISYSPSPPPSGRSTHPQELSECSASGQHLEIIKKDTSFCLRDLGSKYGTFINIDGYQLDGLGYALQPNTVIEFGELDVVCEFRVTQLQFSAVKAEVQFTQTYGLNEGREFETIKIYANQNYLIGREEPQTSDYKRGLVLSQEFCVEKEHAFLHYKNGRLYVLPIKQRGTWIRLSERDATSGYWPAFDGMEIKITPKIFRVNLQYDI